MCLLSQTFPGANVTISCIYHLLNPRGEEIHSNCKIIIYSIESMLLTLLGFQIFMFHLLFVGWFFIGCLSCMLTDQRDKETFNTQHHVIVHVLF